MNKLKSAYNKCIKIFLAIGVTIVLLKYMNYNLPNFDTVLHNGATTFTSMWYKCLNSIITHLLCVIS